MTTSNITPAVRTTHTMAVLPAYKKLLLLLGNTIPLLQCSGVAAITWWLHGRPYWCAGAVVAWIYFVPPLLCRAISLALPIRRQQIPIGSRDFFAWWFALNLQVLFSRLPFLEECLRFVPGCYSMWLRVWGAHVGKLTYWAAGLQILDRQWLDIGDHVTFGAGVRLNPHVIAPDQDGTLVLLLAPVKIGDRVNVGGYSLLVAGTQIAADQSTKAMLMLPPFCRFEEGHRRKPAPSTPCETGALSPPNR